MKRPTILIDLDNVVYDWVQSMARWLYRNHVPYMALDEALKKYSKWEVWEDWNIPK